MSSFSNSAASSVSKSGGSHLPSQSVQSYKAKIVFIMDVTGSMQHSIDAAVLQIANVINQSEITFPGINIQFAFLGYRDVSDREQFVTSSRFYTRENVGDLCDIIMATKAEGGGDTPENVLGGMEKALNEFKWDDARVKIVFHIGDAPHHGTKFSNYADNHPDLEALPRPSEDILRGYAEKKIDYYFVKVRQGSHDPAAQMATIFQNEYNACQSRSKNFTIYSLDESFSIHDFFGKVMEGVSVSVMSYIKRDRLAGGKTALPRGLSTIEELDETASIDSMVSDFKSHSISKTPTSVPPTSVRPSVPPTSVRPSVPPTSVRPSGAGGGSVPATSGAGATAMAMLSKSKPVTSASSTTDGSSVDSMLDDFTMSKPKSSSSTSGAGGGGISSATDSIPVAHSRAATSGAGATAMAMLSKSKPKP